MADVTVNYKGETIAELDGTGIKTCKTAGTYCEGDIGVEYTPRSRAYEITLARASGWVLLTELDDDVLAHIDDPGLVVTLTRLSEYSFESYSITCAIACNTSFARSSQYQYPSYGLAALQSNENAFAYQAFFYPPNNTGTSSSLGYCAFRVSGGKYYFRPHDGFIASGTYRLAFRW